jgi:hypothetical protein
LVWDGMGKKDTCVYSAFESFSVGALIWGWLM